MEAGEQSAATFAAGSTTNKEEAAMNSTIAEVLATGLQVSILAFPACAFAFQSTSLEVGVWGLRRCTFKCPASATRDLLQEVKRSKLDRTVQRLGTLLCLKAYQQTLMIQALGMVTHRFTRRVPTKRQQCRISGLSSQGCNCISHREVIVQVGCLLPMEVAAKQLVGYSLLC